MTSIGTRRAGPTNSSFRLPKKSRRAVRHIVALVIVLPFIYPFYFLIITALKSNKGYAASQLGFPHPIVFGQVSSAWHSADLARALLNSTVAAGIGTILTLALSAPAAEWCARTRSRTKTIVLGLIAGIWMIPTIIWVIPLFVELIHLHLTDNVVVLGVVYGVSNVPLGVYLLYTYIADAIPGEVREAAVVAGAKPRDVFFQISLPISLPAMATVAALSFVLSWGDVLIAAVLLQSQPNWTVTLAATSFVSRYGVSLQQEAAAAIISMLPLIVIFAIAQRGIVKGLTVGAGK